MTGGDRMSHHNYAPAYAQAIGERFAMATTEQLREAEAKFAGGVTRNLRPVRNSQHDKQPNPGSVFDGHRMQTQKLDPRCRDYAATYATYLPEESAQRLTIVELGILRGIGLAIWCDLFPQARVIGLDVDLGHFHEHLPAPRQRGAFKDNQPQVYEYDELATGNAARLRQILGGDSIDICIDDALHYDAAILKAMDDLMPFMKDGGLYFVEDNKHVHVAIRERWPKLTVRPHGALTVVLT
jgi:hypothetical protein